MGRKEKPTIKAARAEQTRADGGTRTGRQGHIADRFIRQHTSGPDDGSDESEDEGGDDVDH